MVNFCLNDKEKSILKSFVGKELTKIRHDSFEKFDGETVYGRVELFFDKTIVLINYDYEPYNLFGSDDDDHPKFSIRIIDEKEATSALQDSPQIDTDCHSILNGITIVNDWASICWDGKVDELKITKAIILEFEKEEIAFQGDYMIPLIDIIKGTDVKERLIKPGDEFSGDSSTTFTANRTFIDL